MTIQQLYVKTDAGVTVGHHLFSHDESDKLLVILPGRGYVREHPALHYLRKMAYGLGYDVLCAQYSFQAAPQVVSFDDLGRNGLSIEAAQALRVLPERIYTRMCFAGKSLGTPLAATLAQSAPAKDLSLLLLTPVGDAIQLAGELRTLAIVGTADPAYDAALIAEGESRPHVTWRVFNDLDHGLEVDDWQTSLTVMSQIITACEDFLK